MSPSGYEYTGKHRRLTGLAASPPNWASTARPGAGRSGRAEPDGRLASGPGAGQLPSLRSEISARNDPGGRDAER